MNASNNLKTSQDFVQAIENNVNAMYSKSIDFATFSNNQKAIWALAETLGVARDAMKIIANVK